MIPRITFRNVAPFGKRAFINCPICGDLPERHFDRTDAQIAWTTHEANVHPGGARDLEHDEPAPIEPPDQIVDEVKVQRILSGQRVPCNLAEKYAAIDAWTGSRKQLRRITGWDVAQLNRTREASA